MIAKLPLAPPPSTPPPAPAISPIPVPLIPLLPIKRIVDKCDCCGAPGRLTACSKSHNCMNTSGCLNPKKNVKALTKKNKHHQCPVNNCNYKTTPGLLRRHL